MTSKVCKLLSELSGLISDSAASEIPMETDTPVSMDGETSKVGPFLSMTDSKSKTVWLQLC